MDGMFGFHSAPDYPDRNLMSPDDLLNCSYGMIVPSVDRIPMFCSDDLTANGSFHCPVDSEAASITRRGGSRLEDAAAAAEEEWEGRGGISLIKDRIASHPCYPRLLEAYIDCQKVGAPPEIAAFLDEIRLENALRKHDGVVSSCSGVDPDLDIFMESYSEMLVKYKSELWRPLDEATNFLNNIQTQLRNLCKDDGALSSDDDENSDGEMVEIDGGGGGGGDAAMSSEDRELKNKLLRKYGGHISNLKFEFSKKKKKGKLPKDSREILLEWWKVHYRWPYPTEGDKITLAEMSGLDQKQINNWFINQRKRHWRPSEHMHFAVMDNLAAAAAAAAGQLF